jgi:hypothetical protein
MGIIVVGIPEWYSSQTCPRCLAHASIVEGTHLRVTQCDECRSIYHRDIMAAEIHAIIAWYTFHDKEVPRCLVRERIEQLQEQTPRTAEDTRLNVLRSS